MKIWHGQEVLVTELTTHLEGNYLGMVLPGTYSITVSASGYETKTVDGITIAEADFVTQNFELASAIDRDGDSFRTGHGDCDDNDENTYPGATELCNGKDNDCDGVIPADEADADADGFRICNGDCDDNDENTYPGASELCNGKDNDCDGKIPPEASFTANQIKGIDFLSVVFNISCSEINQYNDDNFAWEFGDGNTGTGITVFHNYAGHGSYDVTLILTADDETSSVTYNDLVKIKSSYVTKHVGESYDYTCIQDAVNDAVYGEIILVHDGTYRENIDFSGKAITLRSKNGPATTIIDGDALGSVVSFAQNEDIDTVLKGFTIKNGYAENGGGIYCLGSSPTIANCQIMENEASSKGGGIYCENTAAKLINCLLKGNMAGGLPNQICLNDYSGHYNDIQILNYIEDHRIHIKNYTQNTGEWISYYRFFEKISGSNTTFLDDELICISLLPDLFHWPFP